MTRAKGTLKVWRNGLEVGVAVEEIPPTAIRCEAVITQMGTILLNEKIDFRPLIGRKVQVIIIPEEEI